MADPYTDKELANPGSLETKDGRIGFETARLLATVDALREQLVWQTTPHIQRLEDELKDAVEQIEIGEKYADRLQAENENLRGQVDPAGRMKQLMAAETDIEKLREACRPAVERYGNYWAKDSAYYRAADALGIVEDE